MNAHCAGTASVSALIPRAILGSQMRSSLMHCCTCSQAPAPTLVSLLQQLDSAASLASLAHQQHTPREQPTPGPGVNSFDPGSHTRHTQTTTNTDKPNGAGGQSSPGEQARGGPVRSRAEGGCIGMYSVSAVLLYHIQQYAAMIADVSLYTATGGAEQGERDVSGVYSTKLM